MIAHRTAAHLDTGRGDSPIVAVLHAPVPSEDPGRAFSSEKLTPSWVFISERATTTRLILRRPTA
jgi:hypothetical protein